MESSTGNSDSGNVLDELPANHGTLRRGNQSSNSTGFGAATSGEAFDGRSDKRFRLEFDAEVPLWAGLHPDILGIVLHLLPCLADRASMRSVCRSWRSGARSHDLPPPLPLLVLPMFKFSSLSSRAELRLLRCVPIPGEVGADRIRFVGSSDGWLAGVTPINNHSEFYRYADGECFLLNSLSNDVVRLPKLYGYTCKILPVTKGFDKVYDQCMMSVRQVVLSASPESGSKYVVAASSYYKAQQKFALWQPGMRSWHVCVGLDIVGLVDLAFYQGKLYVLWRVFPLLYVFELKEDDHGIIVSRIECCMTQPLPPQLTEHTMSCNLVVWRGYLLLIIRHYDSYTNGVVVKVDVFAVDFRRNPKGLIKIHNLDGDCIFVDSGGCKSFPANLHDGVEGDHIYFVPDYFNRYDSFVYNMRDGRMRPFAVKLLLRNLEEDNLHFPVWLFPSDAAEQI